MKSWNVYMSSKNGTKVRIMKVHTQFDSKNAAENEARRQLQKPGRVSILLQWENSGSMVEEVES